MKKKLSNPTDVHVGSHVRMRRLMLDLSQTDLPNTLEVTFQQVQKYEKGTNRIRASRLQQMSNVPQVPIPFFIDGLPRSASKLEYSASPTICSLRLGLLGKQRRTVARKGFWGIQPPKLRHTIAQLVEQIAADR